MINQAHLAYIWIGSICERMSRLHPDVPLGGFLLGAFLFQNLCELLFSDIIYQSYVKFGYDLCVCCTLFGCLLAYARSYPDFLQWLHNPRKVLNWNIRDLNSPDKWLHIQNNIEESGCTVVCFEGTKKEHINIPFIRKFCPPRFDAFAFSTICS